jgi:DNA-binding response OmpR family regulator
MLSILIVEDDESIANLIYMNLSDEGYRCTCAFDGQEGANAFEKENFDLVLLDVMLPKIDGYELLEYIQPTGTPVIFITAKGEVKDRIKGLKLGADDYLVKPFQIGELLARVEAVLRRFGKGAKLLMFKDLTINVDSRQVQKNKEVIDLTVKEFDLLVELVRNKNIALHRDRLYEKVWNEPFRGETRTLDSHIQRLRKKLGIEKEIKTVFRVGYRLEG